MMHIRLLARILQLVTKGSRTAPPDLGLLVVWPVDAQMREFMRAECAMSTSQHIVKARPQLGDRYHGCIPYCSPEGNSEAALTIEIRSKKQQQACIGRLVAACFCLSAQLRSGVPVTFALLLQIILDSETYVKMTKFCMDYSPQFLQC